ncbi:MAG: hypothetical protein ACOYMG_27805 [Candidatus Methylumidiphilus sp.]
MRNIRLKAHITHDHRLECEVPPDLPEGMADVIVLWHEPSKPQEGSLRDFFKELDASPQTRMTKEEIDKYLEDERNSWD